MIIHTFGVFFALAKIITTIIKIILTITKYLGYILD